MNERIRDIITYLIKKPEAKMAELTNALSLTKRQINYAIQQFNAELSLNKMPEISRNHTGDFMIPLEVLKIFTTSITDDQLSYNEQIFSENERAACLICYLCTRIDYISMDHLTDLLMVSRNTVQEDLKKAEWIVSKYALSIHYDRKSGYQLRGLERRVLQLLSDLVKQYDFLRKLEIKQLLAPDVSEEDVIHLIHNMEQMLHLSYSDESIDYLQVSIRFSLQRAIRQPTNDEVHIQKEISNTPEFKFLKVLLQDTEWSTVNRSTQSWLTLLFLTSNIFERKTTQTFDSDQILRQLIDDMITNFESQTLIEIEDRDVFQRRILGHLRPACFRIKYQLSLGVYSLDSLVQDSNHAILNGLMKELIIPIENWLGQAFPADELELLSYYFGYQLTSPGNTMLQKPRAVVVCANGVMVSKLMQENLKKLFPELHFLASFSVRDFYRFSSDYDLVFTTTALKSDLLQFIIDPIMTYKEQISLRYRVLKELGLNEIDRSVDELMKIIRKFSKVKDTKALIEELEYFLLREKQDSPLENTKVLPALTNYLKPSFITIVDQQISWQDAVSLACEPLLTHQIIDQTFIVDCLRQIEAEGYAGYLGTNTCIPHTTIEHGVMKDGISLLVSRKPIEFPNGQSISFIFPLSFYDLTKHLKAVNQLAAFSSNPQSMDTILKAPDTKAIYQILRQIT
ncbi:PTS sugar transporter subunit IIA [Enterococcus sp.]|uniref:BglG family transcription antiterminator n=1 Tax=Enterococcus sp. TaxID=35783 RepID=UPI0028B0C6D8|nr:PTS sugar transporter subunit IIA [Enterococcus sp.]